MDTAGPRPASGLAPAAKWSMYAGAYAFLCGTVLLLLLGPVARTVASVLAAPTDFPALVLAGPIPVVGVVVWWAVVERRDARSYLVGGAVGLLTAAFTVLLWALWALFVWELGLLLWAGVLVLFLLAVSGIAGVPLMYARRRLDDRP
ncbi:hypothetical protein M0R89_10850 [Halorussus limi]|uniref:Uncharacterized protein n=1 Tax=Halorussus limi TaxID=2938695 RepID=A0A8U0HQ82_9EURY|nr:hypothetical protein [Halorussus limi]UPV73048.1 hypothetical protein M0R89_10850 [Halorussus limi]